VKNVLSFESFSAFDVFTSLPVVSNVHAYVFPVVLVTGPQVWKVAVPM